jgi:hypothetical protein
VRAVSESELLFIGRKGDRVRLALFNPDNGEARQLPVKEVCAEWFKESILNGTLNVRGFRAVLTNQMTCIYGRWDKRLGAWDDGCVTLLGAVDFERQEPLPESHLGAEVRSVTVHKERGVASVDWNGFFRVLSPLTVKYLKKSSYYVYTTDKLPCTGWTFKNVTSKESVAEISAWMRRSKGVKDTVAFVQWFYQSCEYIASTNKSVRDFMRDGPFSGLYLVLTGVSDIDVLDIPDDVTAVSVRPTRKVGTFKLHGFGWLEIEGPSYMNVDCGYLSNLVFTNPTFATLTRTEDGEGSLPIGIKGWNGTGIEGHQDYRNLNIGKLDKCFCNIGAIDVVTTAERVFGSFWGCHGRVEIHKNLSKVTDGKLSVLLNSFNNFKGVLKWKGSAEITGSFNNTVLDVLDLSESLRLTTSVNNVVANEIILPLAFKYLGGEVFANTPLVSKVKVIGDVNVTNANLDVEIEAVNSRVSIGGIMRDYRVTSADVTINFNGTNQPPSNVLSEVTRFDIENFKDLRWPVLDFRLFPKITELIPHVAKSCTFHTIVVSDNIQKIARDAFIFCDFITRVYIPETVEIVENFIRKPAMKYTIYTQKDSAADKFARRRNIQVVYVDCVDGFLSAAPPDVSQDAQNVLAVALLSGADVEIEALRLACGKADFGDLKTEITAKCDFDMDDLKWRGDWPFTVELCKTRGLALLSHITQEAELVLEAKELLVRKESVFQIGDYYVSVGSVYGDSTRPLFVWAVEHRGRVIHIFTEEAARKEQFGSLFQAFKALKTVPATPTNISTLYDVLSFNRVGAHVKNKRVPAVGALWNALERTFILIGAYQKSSLVKGMLAIDAVTGDLFVLLFGPGYGPGITAGFNADASIWTDLVRAIREIVRVDDITEWRRHKILGDKRVVTALKAKYAQEVAYDLSLPSTEIAALKTMLDVLDASKTTAYEGSAADFKKVILASGTVKKVDQNVFVRDTKWDMKRTTYALSDGSFFTLLRHNTNGDMWISFEGNQHYRLAFKGGMSATSDIKDILALYDELVVDTSRVDHFSHGNRLLDLNDFLVVSDYAFTGVGTLVNRRYTRFTHCLAVSKISGKICIAIKALNVIWPVFWTNTFKGAIRIAEILRLQPFVVATRGNRLNWVDVMPTFSDDLAVGVPVFLNLNGTQCGARSARALLQEGNLILGGCTKSDPRLFELALKHPKITGSEAAGNEH